DIDRVQHDEVRITQLGPDSDVDQAHVTASAGGGFEEVQRLVRTERDRGRGLDRGAVDRPGVRLDTTGQVDGKNRSADPGDQLGSLRPETSACGQADDAVDDQVRSLQRGLRVLRL